MNPDTLGYVCLVAVALLLLLGLPMVLPSAESPAIPGVPAPARIGSPERDLQDPAAHRGLVAATRQFRFEIAFLHDRAEVYAYDADRKRISVKGIHGTVRVEIPDRVRAPLQADLAYLKNRTGDWLQAELNLSKIADDEAKVAIHLTGLPGKTEHEVDLTPPFRIVRFVRYECRICTSVVDGPGQCPKCGGQLARRRMYWGCTVHPEVASDRKTERCWKCGDRPLIPLDERESTAPTGPGHGRPE